jgi:hypothetical protein
MSSRRFAHVPEGVVVRLLNFLLAWAALIVAAVFFLLLIYCVAILVFRNAYGVELPNPFELLPHHWRGALLHPKQ